MTYQESLEWIFSTQKFGIKLGLENTLRLLSGLGNPQKNLRFIHVAGTNGKGSVCAMMESILRAEGLRTGLFTSPHLVDFCERIQVCGKNISREAVAAGLTKIRDFTASWEHAPTFFEIATAQALDHFAREKCEIVVLETGMGGRLDATNAITPIISVIAPVAYDHERWLGSSLAAIAAEKAGIIKPGIPVVSARQDADSAVVIEQAAFENGSPLTIVMEPVLELEIGLAGSHQKRNAALAVAAVRASIPVSEDAIRAGLKNVNWPGRFQRFGERYILDGAHNPAGAVQLVETWNEYYPGKKAIVIFGALLEKDVSAMLAPLRAIAARFVLVPVDSGRTETTAHIRENPQLSGIECEERSSLQEALKATEDAPLILIAGSLFLIGEALALLQGEQSPRPSLQ